MLISGIYIASEVISNKFANITNVNNYCSIDYIHTKVHKYVYLAKVQIEGFVYKWWITTVKLEMATSGIN